MRFPAALLSVSLSLIGLPGSVQASQQNAASTAAQSPTIAPEDYNAEFSKVCDTIRDRFWDRKLNGVDWKKTTESYRAKVNSVKSKQEFKQLVNRMLDELHSSHTEYVTDDDYEFYMLPAVMQGDMEGHRVEHIGVTGRDVPGGFQVTGVLDGGPALTAGIRCGDIIVSADGKPFTTAGSFRGKEGKSVSLSVRRESGGSLMEVSVTPVKQNLLEAFLKATEASARVIEVGGKRIAYLHLWTMATDNFKSLLDSLVESRLHNSDGLILDLRDGYGGRPLGYMDVFTRPDVEMESQTRGGRASITHTGYNRPIVVLINGGTRSAKEFFSYQFKVSHRAVLVGTTTAGAFLGAGATSISSYGLLEMAAIGLKVDGKRLEAAGVSPDLEVDPKFTYTDRDAQMSAATARIVQMIDKQSKLVPDGQITVH